MNEQIDNSQIQPINTLSNQPSIEPIQNLDAGQNIINNTTPINTQINNSDEFVKGLPEWDLIPPYTTVRRVNRKI